jgi:Tat protein secretion system quality control protein TatD with DNase activity
MMLIDTHVHLDQIESVERIIQTALQAEIRVIIAVGMNNASNNRTLVLQIEYSR